jgi:hypothetical protein
MFDRDFKELLSAFHAYNVKYLVVGGYAIARGDDGGLFSLWEKVARRAG